MTSPAASKAARTSASRSMKMPDATSAPPGPELVAQGRRERHEDAGDEVREDDVERRLAGREAAVARADPTGEVVPAGIRVRGLDRDRVRVDAERRRGAQADRGDRQDARCRSRRRGRAHRRGRRGPPATSRPARHSRVVGCRPVPKAIPGSSASTTSSGAALVAPPRRPDDDPPPDPQHREVRLPGVGPVGLVDEPRPDLADRPQPERLEVAQRLGRLGDAALGGRRVAGREVGADGRRPRSGRCARRAPRRRARRPARRPRRPARRGRGSR